MISSVVAAGGGTSAWETVAALAASAAAVVAAIYTGVTVGLWRSAASQVSLTRRLHADSLLPTVVVRRRAQAAQGAPHERHGALELECLLVAGAYASISLQAPAELTWRVMNGDLRLREAESRTTIRVESAPQYAGPFEFDVLVAALGTAASDRVQYRGSVDAGGRLSDTYGAGAADLPRFRQYADPD